MSVRPLALISLSAAILALPTAADASVWLADLEVTELTGERIQEEVKTTCRTYRLEETESGYQRTVCAEYYTRLQDTDENRYTVTLTNLVDDDARSPEAQTVGTGPIVAFSNGRMVEGTWWRPDVDRPIAFFDRSDWNRRSFRAS